MNFLCDNLFQQKDLPAPPGQLVRGGGAVDAGPYHDVLQHFQFFALLSDGMSMSRFPFKKPIEKIRFI